MGNRATVVFHDGNGNFSPAVYLHWNGGPESVYGFLEELDRRQIRADQDYECARFIQLVGEYFNQGDKLHGLSLGVANGPQSVEDLVNVRTDHGDNGFYLVNRTGKTLKVRRFHEHYPKTSGEYGYDFDHPYLEEMDELSVAREKKEADDHEYRASFREVFAEITKGKIIEG